MWRRRWAKKNAVWRQSSCEREITINNGKPERRKAWEGNLGLSAEVPVYNPVIGRGAIRAPAVQPPRTWTSQSEREKRQKHKLNTLAKPDLINNLAIT